ncbi:MAG: beta-aspartyl-peptidase (threonine type) [Planctomycetota bacterium]|jgi:beta-aspartyl-peptidase (threonine type)
MNAQKLKLLVCFIGLNLTMACVSSSTNSEESWSIAIHAGAGVIERDTDPAVVARYYESLGSALRVGQGMLDAGATALDTAEAVVVLLENDPLFNAGKGAVFNAAAEHELDSSIMNGEDLSCGAVAGVRTVKNPIRLARAVMEKTRHVLLSGVGAEAFADTMKSIERVPQSYFSTDHRRAALEKKLKTQAQARADLSARGLPDDQVKSTVGCVVLDQHGNLAAATSTGGLTAKRWGRIGDSPIIGAGTYAANDTCAVSCTGTGEEYIRHGVARDVADRMRYLGTSLSTSAEHVVHKILQPDDGGLISVDRHGNISMPYNTLGMFRAAATSSGRSEVAIWDEAIPVSPASQP